MFKSLSYYICPLCIYLNFYGTRASTQERGLNDPSCDVALWIITFGTRNTSSRMCQVKVELMYAELEKIFNLSPGRISSFHNLLQNNGDFGFRDIPK